MIAKLRVPSGGSDHDSGGETSSPSHVYSTGMGCWCWKAVDVSFMVEPSLGVGWAAAASPWPRSGLPDAALVSASALHAIVNTAARRKDSRAELRMPRACDGTREPATDGLAD